MGFDDEGPGATEKVLEEVSEHLDGRFRFRQMRELHTVHVQLHRFRTKTEFEAGAYIAVRQVHAWEGTEGLTARPLSIPVPRPR